MMPSQSCEHEMLNPFDLKSLIDAKLRNIFSNAQSYLSMWQRFRPWVSFCHEAIQEYQVLWNLMKFKTKSAFWSDSRVI
jgi:hypothetical protein